MRTQNLTMSQDTSLSVFEHDGYIDEDGDVQWVLDCITELDNRLTDVIQEKSDLESEIEDLEDKLENMKDELKDAENRIDELVYELENLAQ